MADIDTQAGLKAKHNQAISIVAQMTLEEKAAFCSGKNFWFLEACERLGLPSVMLTDGPHGLRKQAGAGDHIGLNASVPATCFPTASALASSWDKDLLREVGVALGEQCVAENVAVLLGPGINIKRHPLCGRNFEYFSEDPLLSGELAAAMIQGVQSQGVGTSLKHYAVNNQENSRMFIDAIVDERALREIYLRGFEIAIKQAQPWTVMCAYNRVNGTYCSENDWLLNQVLRDEWGFEGLVVTDWGATNDRVQGLSAGLDLEMPSSGGINDRRVVAAVQAGEFSEADLDRNIVRNVSLILSGAELAERKMPLDQTVHHTLARKVAAECMVLLKNDDNMLPLVRKTELAIIGAFARQPRYQGAGSSQVAPTQLDCAFDAIQKIVDEAVSLAYAPGYDPKQSDLDVELIDKAVLAARSAEVAIVFAGLPAIYESEGFDRTHMRLPEQHDRLIQAVCAANPRTVVVLSNGAPVEMPWVAAPAAILEGYLAGQAGGSAVVDVLFGVTNPGGKLAETFALQQADIPADRWFPGTGRQVQYREGLYVGYRYFDTARQPVLFPFGHGLSYTQFEYADLVFSQETLAQGGELLVSLDVTNRGDLRGAEVVQLYVHDLESSVYRPVQELKAFAKIALDPGQTRRVTMHLDDAAFAVFDPAARNWVVEAGEFEIRVGASSRDIRLSRRLTVTSGQQISEIQRAGLNPDINNGELGVPDKTFASMFGRPLPATEASRPYHINSSLNEIAETWLGSRIKSKVVAELGRSMGADASDETILKMFAEMANNMPLRSLALLGGGRLSFKALNVLVALLNKQFITALRLMVTTESAIKW
jgi:beta-glucosidase